MIFSKPGQTQNTPIQLSRDPNIQSLLNRVSKLEAALGFIARGIIAGAGKGVPTFAANAGSLWIRTDGGVGTRWYVNAGGTTWNPIAGI